MSPEPDISIFRPARRGIRKVLGDLEAKIMELVWASRPGHGVTVREVFEALYRRRRIAYTTVMTTMARLARKKLLKVRKAGAAYVYFPTSTQEEFVTRVVSRILDDLLVSFTGPTVERLKTLSDPRAAARAQRLLREISRRRRAEES